MNMNVKLHGIPEQIVDGAIKSGLAKTKTDALLLGLVELDNRYSLLERLEDLEDVAEIRAAARNVASGKERLLSQKEFEKRTGIKL